MEETTQDTPQARALEIATETLTGDLQPDQPALPGTVEADKKNRKRKSQNPDSPVADNCAATAA